MVFLRSSDPRYIVVKILFLNILYNLIISIFSDHICSLIPHSRNHIIIENPSEKNQQSSDVTSSLHVPFLLAEVKLLSHDDPVVFGHDTDDEPLVEFEPDTGIASEAVPPGNVDHFHG